MDIYIIASTVISLIPITRLIIFLFVRITRPLIISNQSRDSRVITHYFLLQFHKTSSFYATLSQRFDHFLT